MPDKDQQEQLDRDLLAAVKAPDGAAIADLLARGADANARFANERGLLFLAVASDNADVVRMIAAHTRFIDTSDDCDFTPFTQAVRNSQESAALALLECGAAPFPPGKGAEYPLDWAIANKLYGVIEKMLKKCATPDRSFKDVPLIVYAAQVDDAALVKTCVSAGADVNQAEPGNGFTALHAAARKANAPLIELLLDHGARLDVQSNNSQTPFDRDSSGTLSRIVGRRNMEAAKREIFEGLPRDLRVKTRFRLHPNF